MSNEKSNNRDQNLNPNNSDHLKHLRDLKQNQSGSEKGQYHGSSSTLDSLLSPSTIGMGTDGTGQNYSGGTGSQATDQNRSGSMSGQTGSEDAAGRMKDQKLPGNSTRESVNTASGNNNSKVNQQNLNSLGKGNQDNR